MNEFYTKMAEILDVEKVNGADILAEFPEWDSLSVLSVIAMLDADYGVNITVMDLRNMKTAGEIERFINSQRPNKLND
jgi:acyl carrier protein